MRITNNMMVSNLISNVNRNLLNMSKMQDQLATGKKVQTASDDPVAASKIIQYNTEIAQNEQYARNASDALSWMEGTESVLMDITKVLQRARELTVRANTGTNTPEDVMKIGDELKELKKQLIMDANTAFAGRYLLSGYHTEEKLLDDNGNFIIGQTDEDINNPPRTSYQVGIGEDIYINTNGLDIYGTVPDTGNFASMMPSESSIDGTNSTPGIASTQTEFKGNFTLDADYSGAPMTIDIGGNTYTVDESKLDFSGMDVNNPADVANVKSTIINELRNASDGGTGTLSDEAEVYFNEQNELVIKAKDHGAISISQSGGASLGLTETQGTDVVEAQIDSGAMTDADIGTNFDNKEMVITLNGESKRITIGTVIPQTVAGLVTATQAAIDAEFQPAGSIAVSANGTGITFSTANSADGVQPELKIMSVKSTKSQLIADFDEVIAAIDASDTSKTDAFLTKLDGHLNRVLTNLSDVGARTNRLELITSRINENNVTYTKLLSDSQDADMSEVIMHLKNSENVYRASLSTGAKVIQPSLIDFLR